VIIIRVWGRERVPNHIRKDREAPTNKTRKGGVGRMDGQS